MRPVNFDLSSLSKTRVGRKQFEATCGKVSSYQSISGEHVEIETTGTEEMMVTAVGKFQEIPVSINSKQFCFKDGAQPFHVGDTLFLRGTDRPQWGYKVLLGPHIPEAASSSSASGGATEDLQDTGPSQDSVRRQRDEEEEEVRIESEARARAAAEAEAEAVRRQQQEGARRKAEADAAEAKAAAEAAAAEAKAKAEEKRKKLREENVECPLCYSALALPHVPKCCGQAF